MENSASHGPVTRKMVRERAVELAVINGRPAHDASKSDWEQAKRELTTESDTERPVPAALFSPTEPNNNSKNMNKDNSVVAIYPTHTAAEAAIKELQRSGFDMKKLSIVGRDYHTDEHIVGYYNTGDRMKAWGKRGAFWGWIWGCLFGSAFFLIPGLGPIVVAGPFVGWLVGALETAVVVGGLSALGAGLFSLGIPKDSILQYETALKTDKFLLIAHGTVAETTQAKEILARTNPENVQHHQVT